MDETFAKNLRKSVLKFDKQNVKRLVQESRDKGLHPMEAAEVLTNAIREIGDCLTLAYPEWKQARKAYSIVYAKRRIEKILAGHAVSTRVTLTQEPEVETTVRELEAFCKKRRDLS